MTLTKQKMELLSLTNGTATFEQGAGLYIAIASEISNNTIVTLSLHNAPAMSSSFMHGSFGQLIENFGVDAVKRNLKLINCLPSHVDRIKEYVDTYPKP